MAGHTIDGDDIGTIDYGIYVYGYDRITIKGGTLTDFYRGVYLRESDNNELSDITSNSHTSAGILLQNSKNNISEELRTGGDGYSDILNIEDIWGRKLKYREEKNKQKTTLRVEGGSRM